MTKSKNWGGARPGAGRRPSMKPPLKKTAITLEEWQVKCLREFGGGSVSAGVRQLIKLQLECTYPPEREPEEDKLLKCDICGTVPVVSIDIIGGADGKSLMSRHHCREHERKSREEAPAPSK